MIGKLIIKKVKMCAEGCKGGDTIMSLIEQSCAELGEKSWASKVGQAELEEQSRESRVPLVHMVAKVPIL